MRLEYDHHFESTGRARFHADHTDLCIGVVQISNGESPEIFCSCLVGGRDPVNKWMRKGRLNRARCIMLKNVTEVTFYIDLWRNILDTRLGNRNQYPPVRWVVLVPGYLGQVLYRGIHIQGSIARMSLIKRRLGSR